MSAPKRQTPWQHSTDLVLNKWQHRAKLLSIRSRTGAGIFRAWYHLSRFAALKKQHRRYAAQIRRTHFCNIVQSAQEAAQKHDMHKMFSLINRYAPKTIRRRIQIRNQHGAIASPQEELDILKHFVADIWGGPSCIPLTFEQAPGVPFTVSELEVALRNIPMHRAVAQPFAPGIAWRFQSHTIAPLLHDILGKWWGTNPPYIPQKWRDGLDASPGKTTKTSYFSL